MSSKGSASGEKSLSVAEYSRQFFERVTKGHYSESLEENRKIAGENFISLVKKLQDAGSKDDIKVPLRVLRDEIGRVFFSGVGHKKAENIETLFQLYDMLEEDCQNTIKGGRTVPPKEEAAATQLLDELRNRFVRLAVGETWDKTPELKFLALKRMYKYMVREQELLRLKGKLGITSSGSGSGSKFNQKFMRSITMSPGGSTWQLALDDLVKAPSNKLFPFVKLLLAENLLLETSDAAGESASVQEPKSLEAGASNASEMNTAPRATSDFSLDDLLGLGPYPSTPGASEQAPDTPAFDPFQHSLETRPSQATATSEDHTFEATFPEPAPAAAAPPGPAPSSNPFGTSSFGKPSFPPANTNNNAPAVLTQPPLRTGSSGVYYTPPAAFTQQPPGQGPSRSSSAALQPASAPGRTSSGAGLPPPSPTASADGFGGSAFAAGPNATRSFSASSEAEVPTSAPAGSGSLPAPAAAASQQLPPTPANSSALGEQAFPTSFPPLHQAAFAAAASSQQLVATSSPPQLTAAGSGVGSPNLQHAGSGSITATPAPTIKVPPVPGPVRQLSGALSPPRAAALARANSSGPQGALGRAASGALSPPLRTASLGGAGSTDFNAEPFSPTAPGSNGLAARRTTSGSESGSGHFVAPPPATPLQAPATGSGDLAQPPKPFAPVHAAPNPSPFLPHASSQAPQPQFNAFQEAPFANGSSEHAAPTDKAVDIPGSQEAGASFNPFGLPSPSFATPVPAFADNRFADVSPMSNAPPPPVPQPMRAPPAPPGKAPNRQYSAW
ncbi:hypothetical protein COCOBI_03-1710 [Coccomyxa sp. Obi]|nr:hypothetical protein COCOBI_03-1710 [Coccomyxa sp. Obi]